MKKKKKQQVKLVECLLHIVSERQRITEEYIYNILLNELWLWLAFIRQHLMKTGVQVGRKSGFSQIYSFIASELSLQTKIKRRLEVFIVGRGFWKIDNIPQPMKRMCGIYAIVDRSGLTIERLCISGNDFRALYQCQTYCRRFIPARLLYISSSVSLQSCSYALNRVQFHE